MVIIVICSARRDLQGVETTCMLARVGVRAGSLRSSTLKSGHRCVRWIKGAVWAVLGCSLEVPFTVLHPGLEQAHPSCPPKVKQDLRRLSGTPPGIHLHPHREPCVCVLDTPSLEM